MPAERFLRRDDQLVEALRYTGQNADEVGAWLSGYRVAEEGRSLLVTGYRGDATLEVRPGHWVVRDDEGVRAVPAYEFFTRFRSQPVE